MNMVLFFFLGAAVFLMSGCKSVIESEFQPPIISYPTQWQEPVKTGSPVPFRWQDFHDQELEHWLERVLASNNDLAIAALRLYRAQLDVEKIDIETVPTFSGTLNISENRVLQNTPSPWTHNNVVSLQVGYKVDLWGKLARQHDATEWARQATAQDLATTRLTLLANASKNYWQIAYLNQRIRTSTQSIAYAEKTLQLVRARYRAGSVAALDVIEAEKSLVNQESVGIEPESLPTGPFPQITADIPAHVLARRPDIRSLELRLREALANVDIKRAQYYPSFNLTGMLGASSDALLNLVGKPIAKLGAELTLPFLRWQQLDVDVKIARNDYEQRVLEFKQALYKALADVNNALSRRTQLIAQEKQLNQKLTLAYVSEHLNEIRYREGAASINFWLDAQEQRRLTQVAVDTNRYEQLQNLAQIYLEFGGNTW